MIKFIYTWIFLATLSVPLCAIELISHAKTSDQFCQDTKERIHCSNKKSLLHPETFSRPRLIAPQSPFQETKLAKIVSEESRSSLIHSFCAADQRRAYLSEFCNKEGAKIGVTVEKHTKGDRSINPGGAKNSLTPLQLSRELTTTNRQTSLQTPLPGQ